MRLTGQPLVDLGMAVAAINAGKSTVSDVVETDLLLAARSLNSQIDPHKDKLGSINALRILPAYWQNNPLAGKNMGTKKAPYQNVPDYRRVLESVMSDTPKMHPGFCQACGRSGIFIDANRSWLPLGAGAESDPCSFPNLRGKSLCVSCFRAVLLVPLGCKLVGANPYFFHLTDPELMCKAAEDGFKAIQHQLSSKASGNDGLKTKVGLAGRAALLEIVCGSRWDGMQNPSLLKRCPTGATVIAFSNAGAGASWLQLRLPAQALEFFHELIVSPQDRPGQLLAIFIGWAEPCQKLDYTDATTKEKRSNPLYDRLCDNVEQRRSLAFLVRAIVRGRKPTDQKLKKEERKVLELYEQIALSKPERFAMLEGIAERINALNERYRTPLLKRLANARSKDSLYSILVQYSNKDRADLHLSRDQLKIIYSESSSEVISLVYLLCEAENNEKGE